MSTYILSSKVDADVVTLVEAKEFMRITFNNDDALIQTLINAAVKYAEKYMNRDLLTTTWENYRNLDIQDMTLRRGGFQSLTKIEYLLDDSYELLADTEYKFSIGGVFGVICEIDVPNADVNCNKSLKITFKTGFGDTGSDIPEDIKLAIKNHVSFMYENRGECSENKMAIPVISQIIYDSYKIVDLGISNLNFC